MSLAALRQPHVDPSEVRLLVADDDPRLRALVAARARAATDALVVLQAKDGAEAIQVGLQQAPHLALIDVNMPRLGGVEVAITLRELRPDMRLALHTTDPLRHRERVRELGLPLFDKLELDRVFSWLELQARSFDGARELRRRGAFECAGCGYGVVRALPPERCPMCQREGAWIRSPRRSFAAHPGVA